MRGSILFSVLTKIAAVALICFGAFAALYAAAGVNNGETFAKSALKVARKPAMVLASARWYTLDDRLDGTAGNHFTYSGAWQHVTDVKDGRSEGTSSRSFRPGAVTTFRFNGTHLIIYGVKGPGGGYADLRIDGRPHGTMPFYASRKEAGVQIYASGNLGAGSHAVEITVAPPPDNLPKRKFVNLDGAAYE
jgi:hypothetical protein